jgi:type I restriction enzyme, S subunit
LDIIAPKFPVKRTFQVNQLIVSNFSALTERDKCGYYGGDIPWLIIEDLNDGFVEKSIRKITRRGLANSSAKIVPPGTLLIAMYGSIGKLGITRIDCATNQAIAFCKCDSTKVATRFLFYLLLHERDHFLRAGRGGTQQNISQEFLKDYEVPLPSLPEQHKIAALLDQEDRLVRTRRYALELTDTFLPAVFLELFGDPAENPRAFDRVQVEELFADSRNGVKCGPFGSALKKHEHVAAGIPVWTMNNVGANEFIEDGCLFITPQKFEELSAYDAQNGDILISRAGTVGRMAIVRTKYPRSIIHSNIIRLSLNDAKILPIYFVTLMTWFAPRVARLKRGQEDAYTFMSTGSLGELQIPLPPFPLQQKFAALAERVEHLRAVQREALRQADHLFASLLDRAFSG